MSRYFNLDSDQTAFFERELEFVKSQTFDIKYPALKARDLVPVDGQADPGATAITYQQFDRKGGAKIIGHNAKDIPRVDVNGKEFTRPTKTVGSSYGITMKEIKAAMMAGRNLDQKKAAALRFAVEEELDAIASFGAPEHGIDEGFVNSSAINLDTLAGGQDWATLLPTSGGPAAVVAQVSAAISRIIAASKGIHRPNVVLIPEEQYSLISMTPFGDNSDKTVLDFMTSNFPGIQAFMPWYRLDGAGAASADRMIVYDRSAENLGQDINQEFEVLPAQEQGLELVVIGTAETAGSVFYYPLSADYTDGI